MVVSILVGLGPAEAGEKPAGLKVTFGDQGLASLAYNGAELLAGGKLSVSAAAPGGEGGKRVHVDCRDAKTTVNAQKVTFSCDALAASLAYAQQKDTLRMTVTVRNTGQQRLASVRLTPMTLRFPRRPKGGRWFWGYQVTTNNRGEPGVAAADYESAVLVACVDEIERPVTFGFAGNYGNSTTNGVLIEIVEPIAPGQTATYRFSLRFAAAGSAATDVADDVYKQFAAAYPYKLNWPDRRPIGAIMACLSNSKWKTNPRGWMNDPKIDVTTDAGRAKFAKRMLAYADNCVRVMKDVGAQGMIVWSIEGEQMPHAITYLGDPRVLPDSAPEMDAIADAWFKKFRDAGLKVGVCIRPSKVIPNGKGGWMHRQVEDHVANIADKIAYAKKRWGCTIFYMDTNVKWPMRGPEDRTRGMWQGNAELLSSKDLYELTRRHPDVLIFPEFGRFGYWSCCMPYGELRGGSTHTSPSILSVYPKAGSTITVADGDFMGNYDGLLKGVLGGDIQLFRGWFGDPRNEDVKLVYREADYVRKAARARRRTAPLADALAGDDPVARYAALSAVTRGQDGAVEAILAHAPKETDWIVRKKIAQTLGTLGDGKAMDLLVGWVKDPRAKLDHFAAEAMGRIGLPAAAALVKLAAGDDRRVALAALGGPAKFDAPQALPTILKLADSEERSLRMAAIRALGAQRGDGAIDKLVALLSDERPAVVIAACRSLARLKDRRAVKPLVEAIQRSVTALKNNSARAAAGRALEAITGQQHGPYERRWRKALDDGKLER